MGKVVNCTACRLLNSLTAIALVVSAGAGSTTAYAQARRPNQAPVADGSTPLKSADGKLEFSRANPEDITDKNFPNLIESFDYPNANIAEVVKAISKLTGKNFILEKGVSGTISIIAPSRITVAEAYRAFLTALAMNGYTIVPSGNFLKIRQIATAAQESIDTYSGNYFPNSDQLITRIVRLKYISAEEIEKTLRPLVNKQAGDIRPYAPTNSLIITDFGSNIERITTILNQLDVAGFEEKLVAIAIRNARAKDIADLIDQIINKGDRSRNNQFNPGIPRFRASPTSSGSGSGAANYSLVLPDTRTNSIIVVGNDAGIERIRGLVAKLDFKLRAEDAGGVYVYYVRHGEAEKIANVLNGIATESSKTKTQAGAASANAAPTLGGGAPPIASQAVFGGDVKVAADKENNSLVITASKQDYDTVKVILAKIDIPRDQVYVKAVILEMNAGDSVSWGIDYYKFVDGTNGLARAGFRGTNGATLTNPSADSGLVLGFGAGKTVSVDLDGPGPLAAQNVKDTLALVNFLKTNSNANILSTPQITATDNEEAEIVVGENVPVSKSTTATSGGATQESIERKDLNLKLTLTPFISPDTDSVRMKIAQTVDSLSNTPVQAASLAQSAVTYSTRSIKTNIIVNSNDTAVLGGLMRDIDGERITKVPVLGDIPVLGWLFKSKSSDKQKTNLLVFITPKIMRNSQDSADLLNTKLNERIDFIQQNMKGRDPHGVEIDKMPRKALNESETEEYIEQKGSDNEPIQAPTEESIDPEEYEDAPPENAPSNVNGRNERRSPKKASKTETQYAKRK